MERNKIREALKHIESVREFLQKELEELEKQVEAPASRGAPEAYGVIWDYSQSSSKLQRVGLAKDFEDPSPAKNLGEKGYSPFDGIAPWSGIQPFQITGSGELEEWIKRTDSRFDTKAGDIMVFIPEFYYTAVKDEETKTWLWAVSPKKLKGYCKHPGSGRFVGRYHTSLDKDTACSRSGAEPLTRTSQTTFRKLSQEKGMYWGMLDLATWSAIQLLYLVEYADFNARKILGKGFVNDEWEPGIMGGTDAAVYHTLEASGTSNQYRWIEDPFSNVMDWIDGFAGNMNKCKAAALDAYTGDSEELEDLGFGLPEDGGITGFGYSRYAPWAFIPDRSGEWEEDKNVTDVVWTWDDTSLYPANVGGSYNDSASYGLFCFHANNSASNTDANLGSRLLKI